MERLAKVERLGFQNQVENLESPQIKGQVPLHVQRLEPSHAENDRHLQDFLVHTLLEEVRTLSRSLQLQPEGM